MRFVLLLALLVSSVSAVALGADQVIRPVQAYLLPLRGLEGAGPESASPFHLWAKAAGQPDEVYEAAKKCEPMAQAAKAFYP